MQVVTRQQNDVARSKPQALSIFAVYPDTEFTLDDVVIKDQVRRWSESRRAIASGPMTNRAQIETTVTKICRLDRILLALPLSATTLFRYLEVRPNDRGHVPCLMFVCAFEPLCTHQCREDGRTS